MKRYGNLWPQVIDKDNIRYAFQRAKKGKRKYKEVQLIAQNEEYYVEQIHQMLKNKTFTTSNYKTKQIHEPKERTIYVLPFYPDRIIQHALMNIVAPIWDKMFIHDSYACRPGKGQHRASRKVMEGIRKKDSHYFLQGDVRKFYPSINHNILLEIIERKIKDKDVLWLFKDIIRSIDGDTNVPIGNYTSQWLGNLYLNELDYFVKHTLKCKNYIRYNDDFVIIGSSKKELHKVNESIRGFLDTNLNLTLTKDRVKPLKCGIDFVGYRHFNGYILLRKSTAKKIKQKFSNIVTKIKQGSIVRNLHSIIGAYEGWLKHANTFHLKIQSEFFTLKELNYERIS